MKMLRLDHSKRCCQLNADKAILLHKGTALVSSSADTGRLSPLGESLVSEESMMNRFEMMSANSEQVLNRTMH